MIHWHLLSVAKRKGGGGWFHLPRLKRECARQETAVELSSVSTYSEPKSDPDRKSCRDLLCLAVKHRKLRRGRGMRNGQRGWNRGRQPRHRKMLSSKVKARNDPKKNTDKKTGLLPQEIHWCLTLISLLWFVRWCKRVLVVRMGVRAGWRKTLVTYIHLLSINHLRKRKSAGEQPEMSKHCRSRPQEELPWLLQFRERGINCVGRAWF